jgi:hypothetical protein
MRKELIIQIFKTSGAPISNLPYTNRTYFRGQTRNSGPQKGNMQNGQFQQSSSVRAALLCFQCGQSLDIMQGTVSAIQTANLTDIKQEPKLTYIVNHGLETINKTRIRGHWVPFLG